MSKKEKDAATDTTLEVEQSTEQTEQPEPQQTPPEAESGDFMSNPDVQAYISKQVQEGIQKALQGKAPRANTADMTAAERAAFNQMTYKERLKLFQADPHTYNKLTQRSV